VHGVGDAGTVAYLMHEVEAGRATNLLVCDTDDCNTAAADACADSDDVEEPTTELASCLMNTPDVQPKSMSLSLVGVDSADAKCVRYCARQGPSAGKPVHGVGDAGTVAYLMHEVEAGRATNLLVCDTDDCNAPAADACADSDDAEEPAQERSVVQAETTAQPVVPAETTDRSVAQPQTASTKAADAKAAEVEPVCVGDTCVDAVQLALGVGLFVLACVSLLAFECGRRSAPAAPADGLPLPAVTGTPPPLYPSLHAAAPALKPGVATYVAGR